MNLQQASQLIEESIKGLGIDPALSRTNIDGQWNITVKGAPVYIDVFNFQTAPNVYYISVMSPLFKVPDSRKEELFFDVLEMNASMYSCAICVKLNTLYILTRRPTAGLDLSEVNFLLDQVAFYSNDYYTKLTFKYKDVIPPPPAPNTTGNKAP